MKTLLNLLLAASMMLAMAFTFSCSSGDSGGLPPYEYLYCVYPNEERCTTGPVTSCPNGGAPKDVCPFSEIQAPSSSSSRNNSDGNSSSSFNLVGCPNYNSATHFCDSRDFKIYKWVEIGLQTWMAENLNYNVNNSLCYDNNPANCVIYGRLYDWATAMALSSSCNSDTCSDQIQPRHKGVCPSGWHIPSGVEWDQLVNFADGTSSILKATNGWSGEKNGQNTYGFSALPGGYGSSDGNFDDAGYSGSWWSSSEYDSYYVYCRSIDFGTVHVSWENVEKSYLFSVRCVKD